MRILRPEPGYFWAVAGVSLLVWVAIIFVIAHFVIRFW